MRSFKVSQEVDGRGVEQVVRAIEVILESRIIKMLSGNFSRLGFLSVFLVKDIGFFCFASQEFVFRLPFSINFQTSQKNKTE
jgi:hypothetical protein